MLGSFSCCALQAKTLDVHKAAKAVDVSSLKLMTTFAPERINEFGVVSAEMRVYGAELCALQYNPKDDRIHDSPLICLCRAGSEGLVKDYDPKYNALIDSIQLLIDAKADVNMPDGGGATPAWWAAHGSFNRGLKVLIEAKADVNIPDCRGNTPLKNANTQGTCAQSTAQILIDAGAQ